MSDTPADDKKDWVAPHRLREEADARRAAEAKVTAYESELTSLRSKATTVDTLSQAMESLKADHAKAATGWAEERAGLSVGLDAEGLGVARHHYGSLEAAGRPAFDVWLQSIKAEPAKAPKALTPWFSAPVAPGAGPPAVPAASRPAGGNAPTPTAPATGGLNVEAVNAMISKAEKTGDWTEYNKHRETILAGIADGSLQFS